MSSRGMKRTIDELVNPMTNPSFPFAMYTAGFSVLLLWELWKLSNEEIPYVLAVPMSIISFGGKKSLHSSTITKEILMLKSCPSHMMCLRKQITFRAV